MLFSFFRTLRISKYKSFRFSCTGVKKDQLFMYFEYHSGLNLLHDTNWLWQVYHILRLTFQIFNPSFQFELMFFMALFLSFPIFVRIDLLLIRHHFCWHSFCFTIFGSWRLSIQDTSILRGQRQIFATFAN